MAAGARGFVLKTASAHELVAAIRSVHAGRRVLDAEATDSLFGTPREPIPGDDLTVRERELLALMARGYNNQEIATELGIGLPTVKFHVTNIFGKLAVDNRIDAVLTALKHKLVPPV
jgi:NarL family two-component system response regulator LiaR